jgi:hypothetical protein
MDIQMPKAKPVQLPPIKFDESMKRIVRVPAPPKKGKQRKVWRKKRR